MVAAPQGFNISHMLQPGLSVLVSMGLGSMGGAALGALLNAKPTTPPRPLAVLGRIVPQPVIARYRKGLYALRPWCLSVEPWRYKHCHHYCNHSINGHYHQ